MATKGTAIAEFGNGDVGVLSGNTKEFGLIAFRTLEQSKEIGVDKLTVEEYGGVEEILDDSDIVMTFSNKKSIDVVIKSLTRIRNAMEE